MTGRSLRADLVNVVHFIAVACSALPEKLVDCFDGWMIIILQKH